MKKLASQIRHVLNKRVVGWRGRPGRRSTGGTRSGAASPRQREILICALSGAASRPPAPRPPRAARRPTVWRALDLLDRRPRNTTPYKYLLHFALHTPRNSMKKFLLYRTCESYFTVSSNQLVSWQHVCEVFQEIITWRTRNVRAIPKLYKLT